MIAVNSISKCADISPRFRSLAFALFLFSFFPSLFAANHYVRSDATGTGTGNDWANAYTSLPATLSRGDTYYIASGSYPSHKFGDLVSGTSVITVKKATVADHGASTGWNDSYAGGQAVFNGQSEIDTSYLVIDGVTGSGQSGHGIK